MKIPKFTDMVVHKECVHQHKIDDVSTKFFMYIIMYFSSNSLIKVKIGQNVQDPCHIV